jgi:hypothetical protein
MLAHANIQEHHRVAIFRNCLRQVMKFTIWSHRTGSQTAFLLAQSGMDGHARSSLPTIRHAGLSALR